MSDISKSARPIEIFYSYSHVDERLRDQLEKQLAILKRQGLVAGWHDRKIGAGTEWKDAIDAHLNTADIILLLVSANFLASDYCYDIEMKRAMERHEVGEARVIPVILRSVDWQGAPFGKLQALPKNAKPVTSWGNIDEAFMNVAQGIRAAVQELRAKPVAGLLTSPGAPPVGPYKTPTLPPIWNIPHRRNPNFTGRADLLEAIEKALASGQRAALTQVIAGLGGVGKTQLAVEYAYRHAAQYQAVWWLHAEQPATLAADYAGLAAPLDLPEKDAADQRDIVRAVQSWLGRNPGWLLILDNAPDAASVREVLPQGECGHVLVTSRDPNWRGTAPVVSVQVMARAESVEFLCKRTGQADELAAGKLADELGNLPLALEQAGAYIEEKTKSFAEYLELFRVYHQSLLERGKPTTDYPDTVATTWLISFEAAKATPGAADALSLLAHFAPGDIPIELVKTSEVLKDLGGLEWQEALAALRRYSLIEVRGETVSIHRLVQAVARDRLSDDDRRRWAEAAVELVADAFPSGENDPTDVRTWPACARLLPHALATAGHAEAMQVALQATGRLLNQVGLYLRGRAELRQAKSALERALRIDEAVYGPDHPTVAIRVNNLGSVLWAMGDLAGARTQFERALRIDEAAYGPDHPNVARDVNNLGRVLQDMSDLAGARAHIERALRIDEAAFGPDHPKVAIRVNNLGIVLKDMGDLAGARAQLERALRIRRQFLGEEHPNTVLVRNNLNNLPGG